MSTASGASNYEYVTARVKARRAALFDRDDYRKLMRMGPGEIARFMEETEYESEIDALGTRYSGVDLIEYALNLNRAKHYDDLLRWADGKLYEFIARYLRRFDAWNAKTAIRGIYSGADPEMIRADLIRAGEFDDRLLDRLTAAATIEEAVELLDGTMFAESLGPAYEQYEEEQTLVPLENAIDRAYYDTLTVGLEGELDRATELYAEFLRAEIDFRNVRNALRLARSGSEIEPAEYYIEGGTLFRRAELNNLVANRTELVNRVRESTYGDNLDAALDELERVDSLIGFEHALDAALLDYADHMSHVFPLSICPVLSYILAKEREVENIRAIARGREAGLSEEEIEEELVIV